MNDVRRCRWLLALALFLMIFGARLVVIERFGSDLPFWDQWDKEGDKLYAEWFGARDAKHLLLPHNEHRILPTLVLNLGLVHLTGQWDARLQSVVSAALNAAVLAGFFLWLSRHLTRGWLGATALVIAAVGVAPIPWENIVSGFQTQFYFLIGFSLLALGGLLLAPAFSWRWWGAIVCAGLALVSMGSGLLCAAPVAALVLLRVRERSAPRRALVATLAVALALGAAGAALHTRVAYHEALHARSAEMFLVYVARCLSWPLPQYPWLGPLLWLPWFVLAATRLAAFVRGRTSATDGEHAPTPANDFLLAAGLWVLAQIAAVSYSRSGTGEFPASRYGDVLALGFIVSFCACAALAGRFRWAPWLAAAWLIPAGTSLALATRHSWTVSLPAKKSELVAYEENVRQFVATGVFVKPEHPALPYPSADALARILRREPIRAILPASVRAPLPLDGFSNSPGIAIPPTGPRRVRALTAPGEWRSAPLPAGEGWWVFDTAGHFDRAGAALEIVSAADGRVLSRIAPSKPPGHSWRLAYAPAPREPAVLRARVAGAQDWIAFSEPAEISTLSYRALRLAKQGRWLVLAGAVTGAFTLLALRRRPSEK